MVDQSTNLPSPELWAAMLALRKSNTYSPGKRLFSCGQPTRGIYLVEKGRVKLFLCSDTTGTAFDEVGPGAVLALSEAISGGTHKLAAVAVDCAQVAFVSREDLLPFLQQNQLFCMQLVQLLSEDLHSLYHRFRNTAGAEPMPRRKAGPQGQSCRERSN